MKELSNHEIKMVEGGGYGVNDPSEFLRILDQSRQVRDEDMRCWANQGVKQIA